jgi:SNF2 family DNA or RNA helicase
MATLFAHQKAGLEIGSRENKAFFWDCGCGKSCLSLNIIRQHKAQGIGPALVVCPVSIIRSAWLADAREFTPELEIVDLHDRYDQKRRKLIERTAKNRLALLEADGIDVYVLNYELLKGLYAAILKKGFKVLIVDESSKMKDPTSQITRCLLALAGIKTRAKGGVGFKVADPPIPHRYCLSGTPAPNSFEEYWGQIKFIAGPGRAFHDNVTAFRSRYFQSIPIGNTGAVKREFIPSFQDEFMARIQKYAHVVKKEDAVDLPEQTHLVRRVTLSAAEKAAYDTFKNEMVLRFADQAILSTNALVEIMKLRQLAGGWVYDGDGTAHKLGDSKLRELKDLLAEIGHRPVIIWANYKTEFEHLMAELPGAGALYGGTRDREGTIQAFKSGSIQYLIANPASAGHGLTFVNCSDAVYYSLSHSYELLKQSQDRIHRIGQRNQCTYYYLLAAGTIDAAIYRVLRQKGDVSNAVLNYLRDNQEGYFNDSETELSLAGAFE